MRRVILWDLMDTLVRDPFFTHVPAHFGMSFDELIAQKLGGAWPEFELDRIDEATLFVRFFADGRTIDGEALKRCMVEACCWIDGMPELLAELARGGAEMHALSNYSHWYRDYDARLGLSDLVELSFVSCLTGYRKPDPQAYLHACRQLGVRPEQCLFIDDRVRNTEAAESLGMATIHFDGDVAALRDRLRATGWLPPER